MAKSEGYYSNYMIYSTLPGTFKGIWFDKTFEEKNLLEVHCTFSQGEQVHAYQNTSHSLGTILFRADSLEEMIYITENMDKQYRVMVE